MKKILGIFLTILFLFLIAMFWNMLRFQFAPLFSVEKAWRSDFEIIAHRGFSGNYPENTLIAFQKAVEVGADYVELDVHFSKDKKLVVMHDATLDRTSNGKGEILEKTWAELQQLEAGSWFDAQFSNEKIPALEEAIQLVGGKSKLLIELKNDAKNRPYLGLEEAVAKLLAEYGATSWCVIQSFEPSYLQNLSKSHPEIEIHQLILGQLWPFPILHDTHWHTGDLEQYQEAKAVNPFYRTLSAERVKRMKKQGFKVFTYTVNEPDHMHAVINMGVDGLITNYPDVLMKIREGVGGER
jgi:glycerophosphoryl diester phosphodiesterase